jgi:cytosine/adenosine deaminase-related metal-dependent hydrolase
MIIRARIVVTMDGPPIENGAVAISGKQIVDVGRFSKLKALHSGEVVDLGEQALLPGLINAHCHLDYTCLRGKIAPQNSFADWIRAINAEKAKRSPNDYLASINHGFAEAKRFGTTAIANLTGFPELVVRIQTPIRTWWFAELIDVRQPNGTDAIVEFALDLLKPTTNWGLAPHALFTASANLYRRCEEIALRKHVLLTTHLAESREEMSMFVDASGPLYEFVKGIGRPMDDCGNETPLEKFAGRLGETSLPWIIAHLNELSDSDFDLLERSTRRLQVVHCPRSHDYFGHSPFQFQKLQKLGLNICLGTDSLASNDDLSLFVEMRAFQKTFPEVLPEKILEMVTVNPARALQQENQLGKLRAGFQADLIGVPCRGPAKKFLEEIENFDAAVPFFMIDGMVR